HRPRPGIGRAGRGGRPFLSPRRPGRSTARRLRRGRLLAVPASPGRGAGSGAIAPHGRGGPAGAGQRPAPLLGRGGLGPRGDPAVDPVARGTHRRAALGRERLHAGGGARPGRAGGADRGGALPALALPLPLALGAAMSIGPTLSLTEAARRCWGAAV